MDLISRQDAIDAVLKRDAGCGIDSAEVIKDLPSAPQWIPCSERLPKEDGRYLCTYSDFGTCVDFGLYTDGQWIIEPIAWMPLPQPWKGADGEK